MSIVGEEFSRVFEHSEPWSWFHLPVFQQQWWLELARSDRRLRVIEVRQYGVIVGLLPYVERRSRSLMGFIELPYWTHSGGPVLSRCLSTYQKQVVLCQLMERLPKSKSISIQCFSPDRNDAQLLKDAFTRAGFSYSTQTTYSQSPYAQDVMDRIAIWQKKNIVRAGKKLDVIEIGADEFVTFYEANLNTAGLKTWDPLDVLRRIISGGISRSPQQVRVLAARSKDDAGAPLDAAIACCWDNERYYYWRSTRRRVSGTSNRPNADAIKLLIVKAMEHAKTMGLIFDADGVSVAGAEHLYRNILKMPDEETRYLFVRDTMIWRWYRKRRPQIKKLAAFFGIR